MHAHMHTHIHFNTCQRYSQAYLQEVPDSATARPTCKRCLPALQPGLPVGGAGQRYSHGVMWQATEREWCPVAVRREGVAVLIAALGALESHAQAAIPVRRQRPLQLHA